MQSLFDKLSRQHHDSRNHLRAEAEVVHSPIFESAFCKVQALDERLLNSNEKKVIKRFLIAPMDQESASESDAEIDQTEKTGRKTSLMALMLKNVGKCSYPRTAR